MQHAPAELFDGVSALPTPVWLVITANALVITNEEGGELRSWDHARVQCERAPQPGTLRVTHRSAEYESVNVRDPALSAKLLTHYAPGQRLHQTSRQTSLLWLLGLVLVGVLIYQSIPPLTRHIAQQIPLETERSLGSQLTKAFEDEVCHDRDAQAALEQLRDRLASGAERAAEIHIVHATSPNAFALPGGYVVVTDSLLHAAQSSEEVAGVLAHELEHVARRHVLAKLLRAIAFTSLWSLSMGDYSGLMLVDPSTAYELKNLEFSRLDEAEADTGALERLHRAGLSHKGLVAFFERNSASTDALDTWFSSHPSTSSRIAGLLSVADVPDPVPALPPESFAKLREACASAQ